MGLTLITAPAALLSTAEAKAHLRVSFSDDDTLIDGLVAAATRAVENLTGRALKQATWRLTLDAFPACDGGIIRLPRPPLISVSSVKYVDPDGMLQTLSTSLYKVDRLSTPGRLSPAYGEVWPPARCELGAVRIEYLAGVATSGESEISTEIPPDLVAAVKLLLGHLYENREAVNVGNIVTDLPLGVEALCLLHKVWI